MSTNRRATHNEPCFGNRDSGVRGRGRVAMNGAGGGCVRLACGPFQAALLIDMSTSRRLDCMTCMSIKTNDGE